MLAKNLTVGMVVDVSDDPFFNSIDGDGGPSIREVEAIKRTTGGFRYILYTGTRIVTYPDDYEVQTVEVENA